MKIVGFELFLVAPRWLFLRLDTDECEVRRAAERGHAWRTPLWRHPDGSLAAW